MGEIVLAAKNTHVPSIWMDLSREEFRGIRSHAIAGLKELGRRAHDRGADTFLIFDTHWIVNQGFHLNAKARHEGIFTSSELPHMLSDLAYGYEGDAELAGGIAQAIATAGLNAMAHDNPHQACEYGTLIPMYLMNPEADIRVLPMAVNQFASIDEGRRAGAAIADAIKASGRKVAILASGSLSHQFWPNDKSKQGMMTVNTEFNRQVDLRVLELWQSGQIKAFLEMLPEYAVRCFGECGMIDTAMLFGALGWDSYTGKGELISEYFGSSGTGQINVEFSLG